MILLEAANTLLQNGATAFSCLKNPDPSEADLRGLGEHLEKAADNYERILKEVRKAMAAGEGEPEPEHEHEPEPEPEPDK